MPGYLHGLQINDFVHKTENSISRRGLDAVFLTWLSPPQGSAFPHWHTPQYFLLREG